MPNFGTNDNDRRTAEAMERIWAARRKEQVMSEVLTEEQIKAFRATGSVACGDGINTQYVAPDARKMILNTIDHWKQRAEQAEADRKVRDDAIDEVRSLLLSWHTEPTGEECQCAKCGEMVKVPQDYEWSDGDWCHACHANFNAEALELLIEIANPPRVEVFRCRKCEKPISVAGMAKDDDRLCQCQSSAALGRAK